MPTPPVTMRSLILIPLLATLQLFAAKEDGFHVVIHTQDQLVRVFLCEEAFNNGLEVPAGQRPQLIRNGSYSWHVVGGTAPYKVMENTMGKEPLGCIIILDAEGHQAQACARIDTEVDKVLVDCHAAGPDTTWTPLGTKPRIEEQRQRGSNPVLKDPPIDDPDTGIDPDTGDDPDGGDTPRGTTYRPPVKTPGPGDGPTPNKPSGFKPPVRTHQPGVGQPSPRPMRPWSPKPLGPTRSAPPTPQTGSPGSQHIAPPVRSTPGGGHTPSMPIGGTISPGTIR